MITLVRSDCRPNDYLEHIFYARPVFLKAQNCKILLKHNCFKKCVFFGRALLQFCKDEGSWEAAILLLEQSRRAKIKSNLFSFDLLIAVSRSRPATRRPHYIHGMLQHTGQAGPIFHVRYFHRKKEEW